MNDLKFSSKSGSSCEFLRRLLDSHSTGNRDVLSRDCSSLELTTESMRVRIPRMIFRHLVLISPFVYLATG